MAGVISERSVISIALSRTRFEPRVWPRQWLDQERVSQFASIYQERGPTGLPPIELVQSPKHLLISDGVTRVNAARVAALTELPASIVPVPEGEDSITFAFLRAVSAATGGHKELTRAERQAGIRRLIAETELGDADIAGLFGVSRQTVWRLRPHPGVADETREHPQEDRGERYLAAVAASEVAERLFRGLEKIYEARGLGLWDALTRDHTAERLARVLHEVHGDRALDRARRYQTWIEGAVELLEGRDR